MTHNEAVLAIRSFLNKRGAAYEDRYHGGVLEARVGRVPLPKLPEFVSEVVETGGFVDLSVVRTISERYETEERKTLLQEAKRKTSEIKNELMGVVISIEREFRKADEKADARKATGFEHIKNAETHKPPFDEKQVALFELIIGQFKCDDETTLYAYMRIMINDGRENELLWEAFEREIYNRLIRTTLAPLQNLPAPPKATDNQRVAGLLARASKTA